MKANAADRRPGFIDRWLTARREKLVIGLLLVTTFALAAGSAAQKSVTVDEYQAMPHGLALWKTSDFHLATGVPLFPSVLSALPVLATDAKLDMSAMPEYVSSWQCGRQFVVENAFEQDPQTGQLVPSGRYHDYFLLARAVSIAVLLLTCALCYGYARSLYGERSGLVALVIACFSPNLLAHGRLITPDIYLTAAIVASLRTFDRLLDKATWPRSFLLGICLGLAALCKLTGLLLFVLLPLWAALLGALDVPARRRIARLSLVVAVALVVGLLVINAAYCFGGTLSPLAQFQFASKPMRTLTGVLPGWLPVPLPRYYFQGIDVQLAETGYTAYLMGEFNDTGFYSYYLIALLVKTPMPVLLLGGLALFYGGRLTRRDALLFVIAALLLLFFSVSLHKNIGVRYVLFLEPIMAIWISRLAATSEDKPPWLRRTTIASLMCLIAIALSSWPHYLPYFNWVSGGPDSGHRWLLDSNLDWGQDLIALRRYMDEQHIEEIDLACFGRVPPAAYGIRHRLLRAHETPVNRHVAISANLLYGLMYFVNGTYWPDDPDSYAAFRSLRPKAILGHSIYVFEMN